MSRKGIARSCGISKNTVKDYLERYRKSGITFDAIRDMDDQDVYWLLFPEKKEQKSEHERDKIDFVYLFRELKKKSVTLDQLYQEYKASKPNGLGRSQFYYWYQQWLSSTEISMRQQHRGGETCYVDYCEGPVLRVETGEEKKTFMFVMVWGASSYMYAEASYDMTSLMFLMAHVRAFEYFGCVPYILIPDNLKTGVTKPDYYEPDVNRSYCDLANHYGCAVQPARVRKPKDKAKAEAGVKLVEMRVLGGLRNRIYTNLGDLNRDIKETLEKINSTKMQKLDCSRRALFEELDKPKALNLPADRFEYAQWKTLMVNIDYHVDINRSYYSVPYQLRKQKIEARITEQMVELFHKGSRVASHPRLFIKGKYSTDDNHMPSNHQHQERISKPSLIEWAYQKGRCTGQLIERIMAKAKIPEQTFRTCLGIINLDRHYEHGRLNMACKRALHFHVFNYRGVKEILEKGLDRKDWENQEASLFDPGIQHSNIRGQSYYEHVS